MNLVELIDEGNTLAKPCFILNTQQKGEIVGYWKGVRADAPEDLSPESPIFSRRQHILTLSEHLFESGSIDEVGFTSPIELFRWERSDGQISYRLQSTFKWKFADLSCTGEPLYAIKATSFPPFEAMCLHGSDRVASWLGEQGLKRHDYWRADPQMAAQYRNEFNSRNLMQRQDIDVIVGGWPILWPEDNYYPPAELLFLFLTLRNVEPLFEGWYARASYERYIRVRGS